jgi:DNA-binding MarR family transcriptional regulator
VNYQPQFTINPPLLGRVEQIAGLRELELLRDHKSMSPQEIWDALGVTKQGAIKLIQPLLDAGLVQRIGTRKTGRYILA